MGCYTQRYPSKSPRMALKSDLEDHSMQTE